MAKRPSATVTKKKIRISNGDISYKSKKAKRYTKKTAPKLSTSGNSQKRKPLAIGLYEAALDTQSCNNQLLLLRQSSMANPGTHIFKIHPITSLTGPTTLKTQDQETPLDAQMHVNDGYSFSSPSREDVAEERCSLFHETFDSLPDAFMNIKLTENEMSNKNVPTIHPTAKHSLNHQFYSHDYLLMQSEMNKYSNPDCHAKLIPSIENDGPFHYLGSAKH